jgi:hypothetical protein
MLLLATPRCIENNLREIKRVGMTPRKLMAAEKGIGPTHPVKLLNDHQRLLFQFSGY